MMKSTLLLGAIGAFALLSPASAQAAEARVAAPSELVDSGTLSYGTAATFPPFEYRDPATGELTGFDIDMIRILAGHMGLEPKALDIDFDGLVPALQGGRIDIINTAMYIKPEREEKVDFVPYMVIGEAIVVPAGNPKNVSRLPHDLSGLNVSVTRGAIGERYMVDFNEELQELGLEPMNIMTFPTNQDALLAVASGRADAFDTSIPGAAHLNQERPGEFEVAATFDLGTKIGIATRKGDSEMRGAVQEAVKIFVEEGDYARLLEKYGLPPAVNYFTQN